MNTHFGTHEIAINTPPTVKYFLLLLKGWHFKEVINWLNDTLTRFRCFIDYVLTIPNNVIFLEISGYYWLFCYSHNPIMRPVILKRSKTFGGNAFSFFFLYFWVINFDISIVNRVFLYIRSILEKIIPWHILWLKVQSVKIVPISVEQVVLLSGEKSTVWSTIRPIHLETYFNTLDLHLQPRKENNLKNRFKLTWKMS